MILRAAIEAVLRVRIGRGLEHRADRWVVGELVDQQLPQPVGVLDDSTMSSGSFMVRRRRSREPGDAHDAGDQAVDRERGSGSGSRCSGSSHFTDAEDARPADGTDEDLSVNVGAGRERGAD
jgi:hypothetical protein